MTFSESWVTESSGVKQLLTSIVITAAGAALAIGLRHAEGPWLSGPRAGFLLGLLMLVIGAGALLFGGKRIITVDTRRRRIKIEDRKRLRTSTRVIGFDEIADVSVGELGDKESGSISYPVIVTLKAGGEISLFIPFFDGDHDRSVAEARCQRLVQCVRA